MQVEKSLNYKKGKTFDTWKVFLICAFVLIYCPFFYTEIIGYYTGDTAIQIKVGMDCLANKQFIPTEIYSWHEGLSWLPHEIGWYYVVGIAYKLLGLAGVVGVAAIFNYLIAGIIFRKYYKTVHPIVLILVASIARLLSFPNYNARPHLFSQLALVLLVYVMLSKKSILFKSLFFCGASFLMAWFHGGMIPILFAVFFVFVAVELVFKQFKTALLYLAASAGAFLCSLLNPLGIKIWTYGLVQSANKDFWQINIEWAPKNFEIWEITLILIVIAAFVVDGRVRKFDKTSIIKFCIICMFIIASCKYCRFMNYTALFILALGTEEVQNLFIWLNDNIFHIKKEKVLLSKASYYILSVFCILFSGFFTVFSIVKYFPTNTMSDCSVMVAYDEGVISCVKQNGYERIYNSFNTGTWLAFYGIPVHIDNRCDPYMEQYSGTDYLTNQMLIDNIADLDSFVARYDCDAAVLDLTPGTTDEWFADSLYAATDRYRVVYDNTVVSNYDPELTVRWMVVECIN